MRAAILVRLHRLPGFFRATDRDSKFGDLVQGAVTPSSAPEPQAARTRTVPYKHGWIAYRRRNRIERLFGHLKNRRGVATRYDRLSCDYLAPVALVSCVAAWT